MPGGFPLGPALCNSTDQGTVLATSLGTSVVSGAANTKGSYAQVVASSAIDACAISVVLNNAIVTSFSNAVDIAIGGAGSEQIIASNLILSDLSHGGSVVYTFPIAIPSGTRIAARAQGDAATDTVYVSVILHDGAFTQVEGAAGVDSIGYNAAASTGTVIDPGGTLHTKGSYAQLIASTTQDYMGFMLGIDPDKSATAGVDVQMMLDIAIGGAGSEQIILPNLNVLKSSQQIWPQAARFDIPIPAGTRIAARAQANNNSNPARLIGLTLLGIYQ